MKLLIALAFVVLTAAQSYGGAADSGPAYPSQPAASPTYGQPAFWPGQYGYGHHHRSSSSSSSSESRSKSKSHSKSDSKEHKKCKCKELKKYKDDGFKKISISYLKDKNGCQRAVVSCPFDNQKYDLFGINSEKKNELLSWGKNVQRVIKCNKKGKWEADSIEKEDYTFKSVGCQLHTQAKVEKIAASNVTGEINVLTPPAPDAGDE